MARNVISMAGMKARFGRSVLASGMALVWLGASGAAAQEPPPGYGEQQQQQQQQPQQQQQQQPPPQEQAQPQGYQQQPAPQGYQQQQSYQQQQGYQQQPPPQGYQQQPPAYGAPPPAQRRKVRVPYEEGMTIPPGGEVVSKSRLGLWIPGLAMFGAMYLTTISVASIIADGAYDPDRRDAASWLYIPVLGPWAYLPNATRPGAPWVVLDGLVQAGGATMFIVGLTVRKQYLVYYAEGPSGRALAWRPTFGPTGAGLQLAF